MEREEAIRRIKARFDKWALDDEDMKAIQTLIPELAESEDERIRKGLVNFILYKAGHLLDEETEHKFIAYLEKQKEQKGIPLMNGDADLYFDNWIQHNDTTKRGCFEEGIRYAERLQKEQKLEVKDPFDDEQFRRGYEAGKNDAEKDINTQLIHWRERAYEEMMKERFPDYGIKVTTNNGVSELKALGDVYENIYNSMEQKPAEKQDYSGLNDLERAILRGFLAAGVENVPVTIIKETAKECLAQMKPAEWSEEDEKIYDKALDALYYKDCNEKDDVIYALENLCDLIYRKRKRIPKYARWKPSEEQIDAIVEALKYLPNNKDEWMILNTLVIILMKLM